MTVTINGATGIAGVNGTAVIPAMQGSDTNTGVFYGTDIVAVSTGGTERMRINSSGQAEFTAGTAALPAITSTGDTNTGVFYPAADTVAIATSGTEQVRVASSGQIGIGGANYGTSGQVLTSGGASAAPSWAAVSSTGRLLRAPQILTSGTSYTTPANCTAIYVEAVGGGGSGGFATSAAPRGGGGGGGYAAKYFTVTASTPYTYAIGAGGAARTSSASGNAGGSTTFTVSATTITASGGAGGSITVDTNVSGGTGTNGDLNISGGGGSAGYGTVSPFVMGQGGSTKFGFGGVAGSQAVPGVSGIGYGAGGSGSYLSSGSGTTGAAGLIMIWEYS